MQPTPIADQPNENKQSWFSPEHRLAHWRTLIDVYFICGGALLALIFGNLLHDAIGGGWLLYFRLTWAAICFAAVISVVIAVSASTSSLARNITQISLAVFLMSLITLFVYIASFRELLYNFEVQQEFIMVAAWAILGIGILCIEKRLLSNVSLANAKPPLHWAISIVAKLIAAFLIAGVMISMFYATWGYISLAGFWPTSTQLFSSPLASSVFQWSVFVLAFGVGFYWWLVMADAHRNRLYPVDTRPLTHLETFWAVNASQVISILLILLALAVHGEHFSLVIGSVVYLAVLYCVYKKMLEIGERKRAEKIAAGTTYIT